MEGSPSLPSLGELLRASGGAPAAVVHRALVLACELLDMDVAYVTLIDRSRETVTRTVVRAVARDGRELDRAVGVTEPLGLTWCGPVVAQGSALVGDIAEHPTLLALPSTAAFGIVSHAGVAVPGDPGAAEPAGTLCVLGRRPQPSLNERDTGVLRTLAHEIAPLLPGLRTGLPAGGGPPAAVVVPEAALTAVGVDDLTRPLLVALQEVTRLGSTYLTQIHPDQDSQEIRVALNTRPGFAIPEGLHVPWTDTLCRRALEQGRVCTTDVPEVWGDSEAAAALGIQVYVSVPVELADGQVWGTLCAADSLPADEVDRHLPTLRTFSRLIAAEVDRTLQLAGHLDRTALSAERARLVADTDALTGCARRHVVEPWLADALASAGPEDDVVVAFLDLDGFKPVNDALGHAAGDAVLVEVARRFRRALRQSDLLARYGGDEFVVAAVVPAEGVDDLVERLQRVTPPPVTVEERALDVTVSIGVVRQPGGVPAAPPAELIARADAAMYDAKRARARAVGVPAPRRNGTEAPVS